MNRRQYFLFPDVAQAKCAVEDLKEAGISSRAMHAVAKNGIDLDPLPRASEKQRKDICCTIENILWRGNFALFGIGLLGFVYSLWLPSTVSALIFFTIMLVSFFVGERFATVVPRVHLNEFKDALSHGEILLAVDMPKDKVPEIDNMMGRRSKLDVSGVRALGLMPKT